MKAWASEFARHDATAYPRIALEDQNATTGSCEVCRCNKTVVTAPYGNHVIRITAALLDPVMLCAHSCNP